MTQSQSTNELPTAVDFSHHINLRSRARHPSPLKDIIRFMAVEDMVSLAGGMLQVKLCVFIVLSRLDAPIFWILFPLVTYLLLL